MERWPVEDVWGGATEGLEDGVGKGCFRGEGLEGIWG